jgi:hypothetical protein
MKQHLAIGLLCGAAFFSIPTLAQTNAPVKIPVLLTTNADGTLTISGIPGQPAQTVTPSQLTPQGALTTIENFFGSFDPALTNAFPLARGQVWTAAAFQNSANIGAELGLDLPMRTIHTNWPQNIALENVFRSEAVAGTIAQEDLMVLYRKPIGDAQLFVGGGVGDQTRKTRIGPVAEMGADKMVSKNGFLTVGLRLEDGYKNPLTVFFGGGINF